MPEKFIPYDELNDEQRALVDSDNPDDRRLAAAQCWGLDKLVYDKSPYVRYEVARHDYGLNMLVDDPNDNTRQIAYEKLGDKSPQRWVYENPDRIASMDMHYSAKAPIRPVPYDELSNTKKTFVDSPDVALRSRAIEHGWGLDKLIHDSNYAIKAMAKEVLYGAPGAVESYVPYDDLTANQTSPEQSQKAKTVDIPAPKVQADSRTSLNQDATQLTTPTKEQTQDTKQVR